MLSNNVRINLFWLLFVVIGLALLVMGIKVVDVAFIIIGIAFMIFALTIMILFNIKVAKEGKNTEKSKE